MHERGRSTQGFGKMSSASLEFVKISNEVAFQNDSVPSTVSTKNTTCLPRQLSIVNVHLQWGGIRVAFLQANWLSSRMRPISTGAQNKRTRTTDTPTGHTQLPHHNFTKSFYKLFVLVLLVHFPQGAFPLPVFVSYFCHLERIEFLSMVTIDSTSTHCQQKIL